MEYEEYYIFFHDCHSSPLYVQSGTTVSVLVCWLAEMTDPTINIGNQVPCVDSIVIYDNPPIIYVAKRLKVM